MRGLRHRINGRKVTIVTLGCAKNLVDSEKMAGQLAANDFVVGHDATATDAGIAVINTCGFIDHAKDHSMQTIDEWIEKKRRGHVEKVFVTGCLSERYHDKLKADRPDLDGIYGVNELPRLLAQLGGEYKNELVGERQSSTPPHFAYLKISEGCNRACSFCVIPKIRGPHKSRPMDDVIDEARTLVANGTKELILIAQDLTFYGKELYGERRLRELVERLADLDGVEWLRLHYTHPAAFPLDVLDVMRDRPNVCNYLDVPLQHVSDSMLKIMRRSIDGKATRELIARIRETVPGICLRTTFLTGHPGETEADHAELLQFIQEFKMDRAGVFIFSPEEDTASFDMADDITVEEKQRRFDELMIAQQAVSLELNRAKVGRTFKTVIDRRARGGYVGRTEFDSPDVDNEVIVREKTMHIGEFYDVRITNAKEYDLMGRLARPGEGK